MMKSDCFFSGSRGINLGPFPHLMVTKNAYGMPHEQTITAFGYGFFYGVCMHPCINIKRFHWPLT